MSAEFDDLGIRYDITPSTETVHLDGAEVTKDFLVTTFAFTTPPKIQASFTREGTGEKIVKLFKKEIQVGEAAFDDVVYVSTDTPEETAALLGSKDIRALILTTVKDGGSIQIDERHLLARVPENANDPSALAALVRIVLKG